MTEQQLLVADSFRVRDDGSILGWTYHRSRFIAGVEYMLHRFPKELHALMSNDLQTFLSRAETQLRSNPGFPRLELWQTKLNHRFHVSLRPLPLITRELNLVSVPSRAVPGLKDVTVKGPNIDIHTALVESHGTEVLLTDDDGYLIEGTRTALMWWQDDVLHRVENRSRVTSVMEQLTAEAAEAEGVTVRYGRVNSRDLTNYEVWAVNALHGIRTVTSVDNQSTLKADRERLARFQHRLGLDL